MCVCARARARAFAVSISRVCECMRVLVVAGVGKRARICTCARAALTSMQRACAILSSVASLAPYYFRHYLLNGAVFGKSY